MKYKQTDITSYFGPTKMKRYDKCKHSKSIYISKVVVEDSDDSDFETFETPHSKRIKKKFKLPFPISDDEDAMYENSTVTQVDNSKSVVQLKKGKLSCTNIKLLPGATSTPLKSNIQKKNKTPHNLSNNCSTFSNNSTILYQSMSSDFDHPKILQNVVISPRNKNEECSSKHVKPMMLVNRPKKSSCNNEVCVITPSTLKTNENEKIPLNDSNNTSTSSNDTIIVNESAESNFGDQKIMSSPYHSAKEESLVKKQTSESVEDISPKKLKNSDALHEPPTSPSHSVEAGNLNLKVNITLSIDPEIQQERYDSPSNITLPSTSGNSNFTAKNSSPVKARKKLFVSSTGPKSSTYKNNLGSPAKTPTNLMKNTNQVTSKKIVCLRETSPSISQLKSDVLQLKPEEEDEILNFKHLDCMKLLFKNSLDDVERQLLLATDKEVIKEFLEMDVHCQYLLMKLFLYVPKWYNINKFCNKIKLDQKISDHEVTKMYNYLKEHKFVDADIICLDVDILLDMVLVGDLKRICAKFRLGNRRNKKDLIEILKKFCRTQTTLSSTKSTEDLLKNAIIDKLGYCVRLRQDIRISFYKAYLLQTFANSKYLDPQNYLKDMNYLNVTYPDYSIEGYSPFSYREQFASFFEAVILKKDYYDAFDKKNVIIMKNLCDIAFERLQNITNEGKFSRYLPIYLQKFSAEYQYISLLKTGAKRLIAHNKSIKLWLQFLVDNYPSHYALGFWYKQLAHILIKYEKDYESAAKIVIQAFTLNKAENIFTLVDLYDLNLLATKIKTIKSYKVSTLFCDKLAELSELSIEYENFPKKHIVGQTDRSGKSGRRTYSFLDDNGEENFGNVEMIVLKYYEKEENYEGIHCEGRLIKNLFTLFFWDIIYVYYVPNTFISKFQHAPLDMYTDFFYKNRKTEIDERLQDITQNWSSEKIEKFLKENWDYHSQEETITQFNSVSSFQELLRMFKCIDRKVLSNIFKRLVTNFGIFHSGLPDLFLWNSDSSECKFVEVKGEGDKLSHKQILWIQYLMDIGANVEVCHVSGVGCRKLKTDEIIPRPTSS